MGGMSALMSGKVFMKTLKTLLFHLRQSWLDFRCAHFGHQRPDSGGYCLVCRRFHVEWIIQAAAREMADEIDRRAFESVYASVYGK